MGLFKAAEFKTAEQNDERAGTEARKISNTENPGTCSDVKSCSSGIITGSLTLLFLVLL